MTEPGCHTTLGLLQALYSSLSLQRSKDAQSGSLGSSLLSLGKPSSTATIDPCTVAAAVADRPEAGTSAKSLPESATPYPCAEGADPVFGQEFCQHPSNSPNQMHMKVGSYDPSMLYTVWLKTNTL